MSGFKKHFTAGLIASGVVASGTYFLTKNLEASALAGAACLFGSLAPDIDVDSIPSRWFARFGFIATILLYYFNKKDLGLVLGGSFFFLKSGKHRGWTHKYSLPLGLVFAAYFIPHMAWFVGAIGLIVHYSLDRISPFRVSGWV